MLFDKFCGIVEGDNIVDNDKLERLERLEEAFEKLTKMMEKTAQYGGTGLYVFPKYHDLIKSDSEKLLSEDFLQWIEDQSSEKEEDDYV